MPARSRRFVVRVLLVLVSPAACAASSRDSGQVTVVQLPAAAGSVAAGGTPTPQPAGSVSWTEGTPDPFAYGAPGSLPASACGVVEMGAVAPIDGPDARVDARVCFSKVGCPAVEAVVPPPCTADERARAVSVTSLARTPAAWEDQRDVAFAGKLYLDPLAGVTIPAGPWRPEGPGCYADASRLVTFQGDIVGGGCFRMLLDTAGALDVSCGGDWSRSCCSHLPLGRPVVLVGNLLVVRDKGKVLGLTLTANRWCSP